MYSSLFEQYNPQVWWTEKMKWDQKATMKMAIVPLSTVVLLQLKYNRVQFSYNHYNCCKFLLNPVSTFGKIFSVANIVEST